MRLSFVNWSLMTKVGSLLCLLGLGALGSIVHTSQQMFQIDTSYSDLLEQDAAASLNLARANRALSDMATSMYWNAAASSEADNKAAMKQRETADGAFRKFIQTARQSSAELGPFAEDLIKRYNAAMRGDCGQVVRLSQSTKAEDHV